jgi:hypothetical protein
MRAVDFAHFAPPTQRTRRDGLDHGRSVPLPVALGRDDYTFVSPAAPSNSTDHLMISFLRSDCQFCSSLSFRTCLSNGLSAHQGRFARKNLMLFVGLPVSM